MPAIVIIFTCLVKKVFHEYTDKNECDAIAIVAQESQITEEKRE
jgi:hypothetical protein